MELGQDTQHISDPETHNVSRPIWRTKINGWNVLALLVSRAFGGSTRISLVVTSDVVHVKCCSAAISDDGGEWSSRV